MKVVPVYQSYTEYVHVSSMRIYACLYACAYAHALVRTARTNALSNETNTRLKLKPASSSDPVIRDLSI